MKNFILTLIVMSLCIVPAWADYEQYQKTIKEEHQALLKYYGDAEFLTGQHSFIHELTQIKSENSSQKTLSVISVFTLGNNFCAYSNNQSNKMYIKGSMEASANTLRITVLNRLIVGETSKSFGYIIVTDQSGIKVEPNAAENDVKIDWLNLLQCVLKYAPEIYPIVKDCIQSGDVEQILQCILKLIDPLSQAYKCIFGDAIEQSRSMHYREVDWTIRCSTIGNYPLYTYVTHSVPGRIVKRTFKVTFYSPNVVTGKVGIKEISEKTTEVYLAEIKWTGPFATVKGFVRVDYER